jgi:ABC-type sugar transport system ATPase subunit
VQALREIDLDVAAGTLVVVVGPSGSGKTTLLRCVAGLETPDDGQIWVDDRDVTAVDPGARDVAMVFQEYALYPHLSVGENIAFGMRARKVDPEVAKRKVDDAAQLLELEQVLDRRPSELSGGERQRVALARAIVRRPKAFLLDEPLSNLDAELRAYMRAEIRGLQRSLGTTTLYVTHDQVEALTMGDRVAVLRDGKVEQFDTPSAVYDRPASTFVARFIGMPAMNVLPMSVLGDGDGFGGLRPENLRVVGSSQGRISGRVIHEDSLGHEVIVHVAVGDEVLLARVSRESAPAVHTETGLMFSDGDVYRFSADGKALR